MYLFQGTERSGGQDAGTGGGASGRGKAAMMGGAFADKESRRGQDSTACSICVTQVTCLALVTQQTHLRAHR